MGQLFKHLRQTDCGAKAELKEVKQSKEYGEMVRVSAKKTEEVTELKRKRDHARLALKRGKHEHSQGAKTELSRRYANGDLDQEVRDTEVAYGPRKHRGVAVFLGPRMGE